MPKAIFPKLLKYNSMTLSYRQIISQIKHTLPHIFLFLEHKLLFCPTHTSPNISTPFANLTLPPSTANIGTAFTPTALVSSPASYICCFAHCVFVQALIDCQLTPFSLAHVSPLSCCCKFTQYSIAWRIWPGT